MTTLFISDLHLSLQRPEKIDLFKALLNGPARKAESLYILGDLFDEFWIGCDDQTPPNPEILTTLKDYSSGNDTKLYLMRGTRDFHLANDFAEKTGCTLITDPTVITLAKDKVLIMHGDTLCTDDTQYQTWSVFITNLFIKKLFSIFPLSLRKKIAHRVRKTTVSISKNKSAEIIDVNQSTVINTMVQHDVEILIHGHTHRKAIHNFDVNGNQYKRIVLGDWYENDCVLIHDDAGFRFERVQDYINETC